MLSFSKGCEKQEMRLRQLCVVHGIGYRSHCVLREVHNVSCVPVEAVKVAGHGHGVCSFNEIVLLLGSGLTARWRATPTYGPCHPTIHYSTEAFCSELTK